MTRSSKTRLPRLLLTLILAWSALGPVSARPARDDEGAALAPAGTADLAGQLDAEVREIAGSNLISRAKKEKRISTAVRVAVITATTYGKDPAATLAQAIELAETAARAAPGFTEVVANAASFAPSISRLDGASAKIRSAVVAAAKNPGKGRPGRTVQAARNRAVSPAGPSPSSRTRPGAPRAPVLAEADEPLASESPALVRSQGRPNLGNSTKFSANAALGVWHEDNIFLTADNKVGDTVFQVSPALAFQYGLESLSHGSLQYRETFLRYSGKSVPNVALASASGDFGYDNGNISLAANAAFQQLNQNTNASTGTGLVPQIFRRDVLDLGLIGEAPLTAKTRLRTGARMNQLKYRNSSLVGTRQTEIPLQVFLETTPKTSVGLGATYRFVEPVVNGVVSPSSAGPRGHDLYYNLAARGTFTPKLSGEVSVGYRTREIGVNARQNLWGFDGGLNFAATAKTSLGLQLARDFSVGPLGESLTTNRYALRLSSTPTDQWSFGGTLSYQDTDFGNRQDDYWQGSLTSTYTFTRWLTLNGEYSLRKNLSTRDDANYSANQISMFMVLTY